MSKSYQNRSHSSDSVFDTSVGLDDHDIPEPIEHWSEQDFDDLVPSWGTL